MRDLSIEEVKTVSGGTEDYESFRNNYPAWMNEQYIRYKYNEQQGLELLSGAVGLDVTQHDYYPTCGNSMMDGNCQLPSGNLVIDGAVVNGVTHAPASEGIDYLGVVCDIAHYGGIAASGATSGASAPIAAAGAMCNAMNES